MSTQTLQDDTSSIVIDECSSWIERLLGRAAQALAARRSSRIRAAKLQTLRKLSAAQLRDIGLDDPQVQYERYGAYVDDGSEDLEGLRGRIRLGH